MSDRKGSDALYKHVSCWSCPECNTVAPKRIPEAAKAVVDTRTPMKEKRYPIRKITMSNGERVGPGFQFLAPKRELHTILLGKFGKSLGHGYSHPGHQYWVNVPTGVDQSEKLAIFYYAHKTRRGFFFSIFLVRPSSIVSASQDHRDFELKLSAHANKVPQWNGVNIYQ